MLLGASGLTVLLWYIPFAGLVTYPIRLLVTYVHEICHATAAFLTLGWPLSIQVFADGSGLTTWTGGPPLYTERYGHPRLRMRHFPFRIGIRERDEWLWCMDRALDEHEMPDDLRAFLRERLHALADHMRNQPD